MGDKVSAHTGKIGAGFFDILFSHRDGDILLLHDTVRAGSFIQQHLIVLPTVHIPLITAHGHENGLLKIGLVQPTVVDGEFRGRTRIQAVQQFGVGQEHGFLVLPAGHLVVDIRKLVGFGMNCSAVMPW